LTSIILPTSMPHILGYLGKLLVTLRDGRKIIGILRSYDQFGKTGLNPSRLITFPEFARLKTKIFTANLVLQDSLERIYMNDSYGDIPLGVFVIRGENVVLLGEIVSRLFWNQR